MGKSLQGASGALIFKVLLCSIIHRTKLLPAAKNFYPEKWLRNTYLELDDIFLSFNGSMLVSMIMALVEDHSGVMYYLNANHPPMIRYIDGSARYVSNAYVTKMLGQPAESQTHLFINVLRPQDNETIFIGSDGKDDVVLKHSDTDERIFNEDASMLLLCIEEAEGDLKDIFSHLLAKGDITDDVSLIGIKVNHKMAHEMANEANSLPTKENIFQLINKGEYENALTQLEIYLDVQPHSNQMIYAASYCQKKLGRIKDAVELAERLNMRYPINPKFQSYLASLYLTREDFIRKDLIGEEEFFNPIPARPLGKPA